MTIPNVLAAIRFALSPGLVLLAFVGDATAVLVLFIVLEATDWIDGKLAAWLDQRTELGARLDTIADLAMYGCLLVAIGWLETEVLLREWPWVVVPLMTYAASWATSLLKFGRMPSYHTRSAKVSWFLALVAAVALLTRGHVWPLRIAAAAVALANVEATALTLVLDRPRSDVSSILRVRQEEREGI